MVLIRQHIEYLPELASCISLQDEDHQGIKGPLPYSISTYSGGRAQPAAGWEKQTGVGASGVEGGRVGVCIEGWLIKALAYILHISLTLARRIFFFFFIFCSSFVSEMRIFP